MEKVDAVNLLNTLEAMDSGSGIVTVEEELTAPARAALVRMLENC